MVYAGEKPKHPALLVFGIMCFYVVMADFTLLTPAIQTIYDHFEATTTYTTVMLAVSITGVISFPSSILFGFLYERIGYKKIGGLGILLVALGGLYPYFFADATDIAVVLISRFIVGLGLGAVNPTGTALINRFFCGKTRVFLLGLGNTVFYGSAAVFALLAGWLTSIGWNYVFLSYAIAIIPFAVVLVLLIEPDKVQEVQKAGDSKGNEKVPLCAYGYCLLLFLYAMVNFSIIQLNSAMVAEFEIGSPIVAGIATSAYTLGGALAGFCFGWVRRKLDKWTLPAMFIASAVFAFALYGLHDLASILICSLMAGWCNIIILSFLQERMGATVPAGKIALLSAVLIGSMNVGTFMGAYYIDVVVSLFPSIGLLGTRFVTGAIYVVIASVTWMTALRAPKLSLRDSVGADSAEASVDAGGAHRIA